LVFAGFRSKHAKKTDIHNADEGRKYLVCRPNSRMGSRGSLGNNHQRELMKRIKYLSTVAICLGAFSIVLAQTSTNPSTTNPTNPSNPNNPSVPGSNPHIPGDNPPRVPGTTNPTGPIGTSPSMPGSSLAPGMTPIGTPGGSTTNPMGSATPGSSPTASPFR